jgi:toxin ParE1/3/4
MKIIWTPLALERASEITLWLSQGSKEQARAWLEGLFDAVEELETFPKLGRKVPEFNRDELREIIYSKHRVIYKLDLKRLYVLTVRHGRQNLNEENLYE